MGRPGKRRPAGRISESESTPGCRCESQGTVGRSHLSGERCCGDPPSAGSTRGTKEDGVCRKCAVGRPYDEREDRGGNASRAAPKNAPERRLTFGAAEVSGPAHEIHASISACRSVSFNVSAERGT